MNKVEKNMTGSTCMYTCPRSNVPGKQQRLIPASQAYRIAIEMFCDMNSYSSVVDTYKCITLILSIFYNTASTLSAMIHKYTVSQCLPTCGNHILVKGPSSTGIEYISATTLLWMQSLHHIRTYMHAILKPHIHKIKPTKTLGARAPSGFLQYNGLRSCQHVHYCEPQTSRSSKKRTGTSTYVPTSQSYIYIQIDRQDGLYTLPSVRHQ